MEEKESDHIDHKAKTKDITQSANPTTEKEYGDAVSSDKNEQKNDFKVEIVWLNTIAIIILNMMGLYGFYIMFTTAKLRTTAWGFYVAYLAAFGVSAGSHRLWTHKSFKATLPMRISLMLMHSIANKDSIYCWVRDHRAHHKYTDTNADPYCSTRGFFFSHMGWIMVKKHPDVKKFGKLIDLSDVISDPVVKFQKKYFLIIMPIMNIILPTWVPMYFWNETFEAAFFTAMWKWVLCLHIVWSMNSVSHYFGHKPYDRFSTATDNPYLALISIGETWHNYHHAFPHDYTVADVPYYYIHPTGKLLEILSWFGLVYDLKTTPLELTMNQAEKHGDGTIKKPRVKAKTGDYSRIPFGFRPIRNRDDSE